MLRRYPKCTPPRSAVLPPRGPWALATLAEAGGVGNPAVTACNIAIVTGVPGTAILVIGAMAAFAFSRYRFAGRRLESGLFALGLMTAVGVLFLVGGRSEMVRGLRGDGRDEYWARMDVHASYLAGMVTIGPSSTIPMYSACAPKVMSF